MKKSYSQKVIDFTDKDNGFVIPKRKGDPYEDAEQLTRNELIGQVNRLGYLLATVSAELDKVKKA